MKKVQAGFTLIELVVVIVILGILAVTALPKFIDLSTDASLAAVKGVAGSISSASAINYGARKANVLKGQAVVNCSDGASLLQGGVLPGAAGDYTITAATVAVDASVSCTLTGKNAQASTFVLIGIL